MDKKTEKKLKKLHNVCAKFINEHNISCEETIYQCDWVIENAYGLIENICDIVGYSEEDEDVELLT